MTAYNKVTLDNEVLIDLSSDTVSSASHIMSGYVGHLNDGTQVTGTGGGAATLGTKSITSNGTYAATSDSLDGYSSVTVNVPGYTLDNLSMRSSISGDIVLPTATRIAPYTFINCTGITSFSAPNVIRFTDQQDSNTNGNGSYIFSGCTSLASVNMPALTAIGSGGYQFYNCTSLTSIHIPSVPGQHMMDGCTALQTAVFENQGAWNGYGLQNCTNLTKLDGMPTRIYTSEFNKASKLTTIVLRTPTVPTLSNINAFANTPFANGKTGGTIYIPKALYDHLGDGSSSDYKAASNWSTVNGYGTITWAAIEGSQYETAYADGTPISA